MFVLIHRKEKGTPHVLRRYETLRGALTGMRVSNRNAGWMRTTRCYAIRTHMEWCHNDRSEYDYGPYVVMYERDYEDRYKLNDLVEVTSLMNGQTVQIPRKDVGTCVDPSTERYWSM